MNRKERKSNVKKSSEGYDLYANLYDKKLSFLDSFEKGRLIPTIGPLKAKKVLDLGCGTGRLIERLRGAGELIGADISEEMLNLARRKYPDVKFVQTDILSTQFADEEFDVVVSAFVIVHLKDLRKAFNEVNRILKKDGIFVLTNINQRKAPKLQIDSKNKIVIKSFYHMPEHVNEALEDCFFKIESEEFVEEEGKWITQIIKASKF